MLPFEARFRFVDVDIVVRTNARRFWERTIYLYSYFRVQGAGTPALVFSAIESNGRFSVYERERRLYTGREFSALVVLERQMANAALERLDRFCQLHAGAMSREGVGLLFPGTSRSGKSTLMFGLLTVGFRYLSDDVILLDPETLQAIPFPRSLGIKGKARDLAMRMCPALRTEGPALPHGENLWYLSPGDVASEPWGEACPVDCVIFPRYDPSRPSALTEVGRGWSAAALVRLSLNAPQHRERNLDCAVRLVRHARCYRLSVDRLEDAVSAVFDLVSRR